MLNKSRLTPAAVSIPLSRRFCSRVSCSWPFDPAFMTMRVAWCALLPCQESLPSFRRLLASLSSTWRHFTLISDEVYWYSGLYLTPPPLPRWESLSESLWESLLHGPLEAYQPQPYSSRSDSGRDVLPPPLRISSTTSLQITGWYSHRARSRIESVKSSIQ